MRPNIGKGFNVVGRRDFQEVSVQARVLDGCEADAKLRQYQHRQKNIATAQSCATFPTKTTTTQKWRPAKRSKRPFSPNYVSSSDSEPEFNDQATRKTSKSTALTIASEHAKDANFLSRDRRATGSRGDVGGTRARRAAQNPLPVMILQRTFLD